MPTNTNAYNSRITDEALEKRFRDTFRAQGGAELVDDLYAQGVIVPVVDFTQAATGDVLGTNLQTAWDSSTGSQIFQDGSSGNLITNAGFWQVDVVCSFESTTNYNDDVARIAISDGLTSNLVWNVGMKIDTSSTDLGQTAFEQKFVVFLRSGDSLTYFAASGLNSRTTVWYRQIATVNGDLVNPTGFTSS